MSSTSTKWLVPLLSLLVVTGVNAAPTANTCNFILTSNFHTVDTPTPIVQDNVKLIEAVNFELAILGREIMKPKSYVASATSNYSQRNYVRPLPAVPAAILMTIVGFLCVSLVRDRRTWLAVLAGLLWAGQHGIQVLPQLASRLSHARHNQRQVAFEVTCPHRLETSHRLRSDIEGTQYIVLLRHLARIPDTRGVSQLYHRSRPSGTSGQSEDSFRAAQFVLMRLSSCPIPATNCLAPRVEESIYSSPAFFFDKLPRGPPLLA